MSVDTFDVAVIGATGTVGTSMLAILEERKFPVGKVYALASERSADKHAVFNDTHLKVEELASFDFAKVRIALFSAGAAISAKYAPEAAATGCVVIDNTSRFRYEPDIPLVVPEVNPLAVAHYKNRGIIANPNCSTIQMMVALKPIYDAVGIERINVATYQSVSGAGAGAIEELAKQAALLLNGQPVGKNGMFAKQIAFNVLPQIDEFQDNGYTREEMKMLWETRKILDDDSIQVNATAVRVPVFYGHSEALHIETREKLTAAQARTLLRQAPGVVVLDERRPGGYPTAVTEAAHKDAVFVGRIREDLSHPRGLDLWVVADNVRKGAALNSVQVAELLVKSYL
ncbi:MAG TPA: aspartate-semialdehyde dehydrogenase [Gammaproteobacteria bacterium]|nr:aspartate-semialdehyde dehydrogenase [Gammaproteobacteria bacterium]